MNKNQFTCHWQVKFQSLAYDGGGSASWTQYYRTNLGARFSMFWNLHISSWGGSAILSKVKS
jgi:hypothetical protein